ncbi:MAG: hypothetical protein ACXWV1_05865 [Chitinophagaceae bacterium]
MKKVKIFALFNALSLFAQAGLFYVVHFQLVDQFQAVEIANVYNSFLTPIPGMSFIIWGVLYTGLLIFCLYHLVMVFSRPGNYTANQDTARVNIFFISNNLAAMGWMMAIIKNELLISLILLGVQLTVLIIIHHRLNIYRRYRRAKSNICTQIPLSIYFGWLTIMALAGISVYLELSSALWSIILIGILVFISLLVVFIRHNIFYSLMIITGLFGIIFKTESMVTYDYNIILAAWIGIGILCVGSFIKLVIDFLLREPYSAIFHKAAV